MDYDTNATDWLEPTISSNNAINRDSDIHVRLKYTTNNDGVMNRNTRNAVTNSIVAVMMMGGIVIRTIPY